MCNTEEDRGMVNGYPPLVNSNEMNKLTHWPSQGERTGSTSARNYALMRTYFSEAFINPPGPAVPPEKIS